MDRVVLDKYSNDKEVVCSTDEVDFVVRVLEDHRLRYILVGLFAASFYLTRPEPSKRVHLSERLSQGKSLRTKIIVACRTLSTSNGYQYRCVFDNRLSTMVVLTSIASFPVKLAKPLTSKLPHVSW